MRFTVLGPWGAGKTDSENIDGFEIQANRLKVNKTDRHIPVICSRFESRVCFIVGTSLSRDICLESSCNVGKESAIEEKRSRGVRWKRGSREKFGTGDVRKEE